MLDLRAKLDEGIIVDDGAIGTLLADRGVAQPCSVREKLADLGKDDVPSYGAEVARSLLVGAAPRWRGLPEAAGLDTTSGEERGRSG